MTEPRAVFLGLPEMLLRVDDISCIDAVPVDSPQYGHFKTRIFLRSGIEDPLERRWYTITPYDTICKMLVSVDCLIVEQPHEEKKV